MKKLISLTLLTLISFTIQANGYIPKSFDTSAKWMYKIVYAENPYSFYCDCQFDENRQLNGEDCGYIPKNPDSKRSYRVEAEHITTATRLGEGLECYGDNRVNYDSVCLGMSGKDCCLKTNTTYREAHNNLVNLVPAIGELNAARYNRRFGEIEGEKREYGVCDIEFIKGTVEPPKIRLGEIARMRLYMYTKYGEDLKMDIRYSEVQELIRIAADNPPNQQEIERNLMICRAQGEGNPLVSICPR